MKENKYTKIKEFNGQEGETWYIFLREDGNEGFINKLKNTCCKFEEDMDENQLSVIESYIPEIEVDILLRHNIEGYFSVFNKCNTIINPDVIDDSSSEKFINGFYKLGWFRV